jgi:proteic killer suppression protein
VIRSYGDKDTERLSSGQRVRRFAAFERVAQRKLAILDAAETLQDLRLPGLHLERLKKERAGFHSIRINDQWRILFHWIDGHAQDVIMEDYH